MIPSTSPYTSSVGILSTLFASSGSFLKLSLQIDYIRGFILAKDASSPEYMLCPTSESPTDIIRLFDDEENTCPGQMPGYFYLPLLTGGPELAISQPDYDIKLEFICNIFSYYTSNDNLRRLPG
jgi:hypothetical protein